MSDLPPAPAPSLAAFASLASGIAVLARAAAVKPTADLSVPAAASVEPLSELLSELSASIPKRLLGADAQVPEPHGWSLDAEGEALSIKIIQASEACDDAFVHRLTGALLARESWHQLEAVCSASPLDGAAKLLEWAPAAFSSEPKNAYRHYGYESGFSHPGIVALAAVALNPKALRPLGSTQAAEALDALAAGIESFIQPEASEKIAAELSKGICCAFAVGKEPRLFYPVHDLGLKISTLRSESGSFKSAYAYEPSRTAPSAEPMRAEISVAESRLPIPVSFGERLEGKARTIPGAQAILPSAKGLGGALPPLGSSVHPTERVLFSVNAGSGQNIPVYQEPDDETAAQRLRNLALLATGHLLGASSELFVPGEPHLFNPRNPLLHFRERFKAAPPDAAALAKKPVDSALLLAGTVVQLRDALSIFSRLLEPGNEDSPLRNEQIESLLALRARFRGDGGDLSAEASAGAAGMRAAAEAALERLRPLAESADKAAVAFEKLAGALEKRAIELALDRENAWFEAAGLSDAIAAAEIGNPQVSAKHLAFYAQNPETARAAVAAHADPQGRLALALSRCAGLSAASDPEQFKTRIRASCSEQGLSPAAFDAAALDERIGGALSKMASSVFSADPRVADAARLAALRTAFRAVSGWAEAGFPEGFQAQIETFVDNSLDPNRPTDWRRGDQPAAENAFAGPQISPLTVRTVEQAEVALARAEAKARLSNRLALLLVRNHGAEASDAPHSDESKDFIVRLRSSEFAPRRWELLSDAPSVDEVDVLFELPASIAPAAKELRSAGPQSLCAFYSAMLSNPAEASGPNELASIGRETLKTRFGLSSGAWKSLSDPVFAEAVLAGLRPQFFSQQRFASLYALAESNPEGGAKAHVQTTARWLSWASQMNFSKEASALILSSVRAPGAGRFAIGGLDTLWKCLGEAHPIAALTCERSDEARMALNEIKAREERAPFIAKAMAERAAALLSKAAKTSEGPAAASTALAADFELMSDWITRSEPGFWQAMPAKPTWGVLDRLQREWHEAMAVGGLRSGSSKPQWHCLAGEISDGGLWSAVEMANGNDLVDEGSAMHHCVSSYSGNCKSGRSRIFSIRRGGERVCTLELSLRSPDGSSETFSAASPDADARWTIVQNKGRCNAAVEDPTALDFCSVVEAQYNAKYAEYCAKKSEARSEAAQKAAQTRASRKKPDAPAFALLDDDALLEAQAPASKRRAP